MEGGFGFSEVAWLKAHLSLEAAVNQGFPWQWWAVNWYADQLAKEAAQRHAVDSLLLEQLRVEDSIAQRILERNVTIAIALAPSKGQRGAGEATSLTPKLTKQQLAAKLAREKGHSLSTKYSCTMCRLQIPMHRSMAEIEAVLHMQCPLVVSRKFCGIDMIRLEHHLKHTDDIYLVGQERVHSSHALANHFGLGLRFCSCCGAHGQNRSNNLKKPCPGRASDS